MKYNLAEKEFKEFVLWLLTQIMPLNQKTNMGTVEYIIEKWEKHKKEETVGSLHCSKTLMRCKPKK